MSRVLLVIASSLGVAVAQPLVDIPGLGKVKGMTVEERGVQVEQFFGLRYATSKRFRSPESAGGWTGVLDATAPKANCPGGSLRVSCAKFGESEDCLFLNIHRPEGTSQGAGLPVVLYIHPGSYVLGCGAMWPAHSLVSRSGGSFLAVTINYRLNLFGFMGSKALTDAHGSTGSLGLQDLILGVEWIKAHIQAFGGDPSNLALWGQSAGGGLAAALVATQPRGTFTKAVLHSPFLDVATPSDAEEQFKRVVQQVGCQYTGPFNPAPPSSSGPSAPNAGGEAPTKQVAFAVKCLQGLSFRKLLTTVDNSQTWPPVIDGVVLKKMLPQYFVDGDFDTNVRLLTGSLPEEIVPFIGGLDVPSEAVLDFLMTSNLPGIGPFLPALKDVYAEDDPTLLEYPPVAKRGGKSLWWWKLMRMISDIRFTCPMLVLEYGASAHGASLYRFLNTHPSQTATGIEGDGPGQYVAQHSSDNGYFWSCPSLYSQYLGGPPCSSWASGDEKQFSDLLSGHLVTFLSAGTPGGDFNKPFNFAGPDANIYRFDVPPGAAPGGKGAGYLPPGIYTRQCAVWSQYLQSL